MEPVSVLLVDDNPTFLRVAERFLQGYEDVTVAGLAVGGKEGLEQACALRPKIVLVDLAMPDLPGLEAIPLLRRLIPRMGIIALTIMDTDDYRQAALAAGADQFVTKVSMSTDLLPAIRALAIRRRPSQESQDL
jgi:DNA-binding NarL/FixJ family response regulator